MDLRTGRSPWSHDGLGVGVSRPAPLAADEACDALVIGSGVSGAMAAFHLAQAGADVVVVDRRPAASGSVAISTALIQYELDLPMVELVPRLGLADAQAVYRATRGALDDLRALVESNGLDCDLTQRPTLFLARDAADVAHLQHEALARSSIGIEAAWLDGAALAARYGIAGRPGAVRSSVSYELDPRKLTAGLLAAAVRLGARVYDRTSVAADPWEGSTPTFRTPEGHAVRCAHVVYATGYETAEQFPQLAGLSALRSTFALLTRPVDPATFWPERALLWEFADPYLYARTTADDRVLIGGEDVEGIDPAARDALLPEKTARLLAAFGDLTGRRDLVVDHAWAGTFAATADGLPFIGAPDCTRRCYFTLCYGGNGILFALVGAQLLRDAILCRHNASARLFGFDRATAPLPAGSLGVACP